MLLLLWCGCVAVWLCGCRQVVSAELTPSRRELLIFCLVAPHQEDPSASHTFAVLVRERIVSRKGRASPPACLQIVQGAVRAAAAAEHEEPLCRINHKAWRCPSSCQSSLRTSCLHKRKHHLSKVHHGVKAALS